MTNFNTIEELRTKEELINYFKAMGKSITEEEIETLKKSYEEAENKTGALTLQQLDDVAGGIFGHMSEKGEVTYHKGTLSDSLIRDRRARETKDIVYADSECGRYGGDLMGVQDSIDVEMWNLTPSRLEQYRSSNDYIPVLNDKNGTIDFIRIKFDDYKNRELLYYGETRKQLMDTYQIRKILDVSYDGLTEQETRQLENARHYVEEMDKAKL